MVTLIQFSECTKSHLTIHLNTHISHELDEYAKLIYKLPNFTSLYCPLCILLEFTNRRGSGENKGIMKRDGQLHVRALWMFLGKVEVPTYLHRRHTGNGSGRSSLCCSSPGWRQPPGSGSISEGKEGRKKPGQYADSPLPQAFPRAHHYSAAEEESGAGWAPIWHFKAGLHK